MATDQIITFTCHYQPCGKQFTGHKRRFCSRRCRELTRYEGLKQDKPCTICGVIVQGTTKEKVNCPSCVATKARARNLKRHTRPNSTCRQCGISYKPKATNRTTFCSRDCAYAWKKENSKWRLPPYPLVLCYCSICGHDFPCDPESAWCAKYCSDGCSYLAMLRASRDKYIPKPAIYKKQCTICRKSFQTNRPIQASCSDACSIEHNRQVKLDGKRKRRARLAACTIIDYSRWEIFHRDGWTCYICNRDLSARHQCPHPLTPTIDHVIPISKFGDDAPWNVKCCCFECNSAKGDDVIEDLD